MQILPVYQTKLQHSSRKLELRAFKIFIQFENPTARSSAIFKVERQDVDRIRSDLKKSNRWIFHRDEDPENSHQLSSDFNPIYEHKSTLLESGFWL